MIKSTNKLEWKSIHKTSWKHGRIHQPEFDINNPTTFKQRTQEWFNIRKTSITASDLIKIFNFFPKSDQENSDYIHKKVCEAYYNLVLQNMSNKKWYNELPPHIRKKQIIPPFETNDNIKWGEYHEDNALGVLYATTDRDITETGFWTNDRLESRKILQTYSKINLPLCLGASPDGILLKTKNEQKVNLLEGLKDDENYCIEIKCSSPFNEFVKCVARETIPSYYVPQVLLQMHLTQTKFGIFVSYTPEGGCTIFQTTFDEKLFNLMMNMVCELIEKIFENPCPFSVKGFWSESKQRKKKMATFKKSLQEYSDNVKKNEMYRVNSGLVDKIFEQYYDEE